MIPLALRLTDAMMNVVNRMYWCETSHMNVVTVNVLELNVLVKLAMIITPIAS
jgi:hypothetical protein